jgi:hypothetical protein
MDQSPEKQLIALDYDGTYTRDPAAWLMFIELMLIRGHEVKVVTMRYPSERDHHKTPMDPRLIARVGEDGMIFTSRQAKGPFCEAMGLFFHIWVEDTPRAIHESAEQIWGWRTPEGVVHDPTVDTTIVRPLNQSSNA